MRWSSLLIALLLMLAPAPSLAEGVRPDLLPVVAPESVLAGLDQPLVARTLCTMEPSKERRWEVLNLTREAVTFTWQVMETEQAGTYTLTGGARTQVTAKAADGKSTLRLLVNGVVVTTSPNWGTKCTVHQPGRALTWRKSAPPPAPSRPAQSAPLCYRQPTERRWRVKNLTDAPLTLTMKVEAADRGTLVLAARGETEVALEAIAPPNRLRLYLDGRLVAESANPDTPCSKP